MASYKSITIIKSPYHVGIKDHRVGRGPQALLDAGLVEQIMECTDIPVKVVEIDNVVEEPTKIEGDIGRSFAVIRNVEKAVHEALERQSWPLVLGGNCMGVVGVYAGCGSEEVIWFDAHADLETLETTTSGYLDGLGGSMLLGKGFGSLLNGLTGFQKISGRQLVGVAMREISENEEQTITKNGVRVVRGGKAMDQGEYAKELGEVLGSGPRNAVLHIDVDSLDLSVGKANDFAVEGGLGRNDLLECVSVVAAKRSIKAMHVASFCPDFDGKEDIARAAIAAIVEVVRTVSSRQDP